MSGLPDGLEIWEGNLSAGGSTVALVLKLAGSAAAIVRPTDDPEEPTNILVDRVVREGQTLLLQMKAVGAVYEGVLSDDGREIQGNWNQHGQSRPLVFRRA